MMGHQFEPSYTGMVCGAMVMRDGGGDQCGLPASEHGRPKWADLFGIDPDYTGGVPVDEWLEANRGEA